MIVLIMKTMLAGHQLRAVSKSKACLPNGFTGFSYFAWLPWYEFPEDWNGEDFEVANSTVGLAIGTWDPSIASAQMVV